MVGDTERGRSSRCRRLERAQNARIRPRDVRSMPCFVAIARRSDSWWNGSRTCSCAPASVCSATPRGRGRRTGSVPGGVSIALDLARRRAVRRVAGADRGRLALRRAAQRSRRDVVWIDPAEPEFVGASSGPAAGLARLALERRSVADPAAVAVRADEAAAVRSAVARLDEPYREIVALRFFGELSLGEIAAEADRPLATVKTQLRRGLLRLRQVLGEDRR